MLEVTDLTVSYGAISALRNVSLTVSKGENRRIVGIVHISLVHDQRVVEWLRW